MADAGVKGRWPEKPFIFVCTASKASRVNVLPILHSGRNIERIIMFCGIKDSHKPTKTEQTEAEMPLLNFKGTLKQLQLTAQGFLDVRYGDAEDPEIWRRHMDAICEKAQADGVDVIFSIDGGRKPTVMGATLGARGRASFLHLHATQNICERVFDRPDGLVTVQMPVHEGLSASAYLSLYGCEIRNPHSMQKRMNALQTRGDAIERFASALLADDGLHRVFGRELGNVQPNGVTEFDLKKRDTDRADQAEQAAALVGVLHGLGGLAHLGGTRIKADAWGVHLLRGGWLEALCYKRLRTALEAKIEVCMGLEIGDAADRGPVLTEFDIAVMLGDQLHVVECKARVNSLRTNRNSGSNAGVAQDVGPKKLSYTRETNLDIEKFASFKHRLMGPTGQAFFVNPMIAGFDAGHLKRLSAGGIKGLAGRDAVDKLVQEFRTLAGG